MSKKELKPKIADAENIAGKQINLRSLIAEARGIEPLIIGIFVIVIYWIAVAIAYTLSWKFGRL